MKDINNLHLRCRRCDLAMPITALPNTFTIYDNTFYNTNHTTSGTFGGSTVTPQTNFSGMTISVTGSVGSGAGGGNSGAGGSGKVK